MEAIIEDQNGDVWIGTNGNGLLFLDTSADILLTQAKTDGGLLELPSNRVSDVYLDQQDHRNRTQYASEHQYNEPLYWNESH